MGGHDVYLAKDQISCIIEKEKYQYSLRIYPEWWIVCVSLTRY